jgi:hypothetical protein
VVDILRRVGGQALRLAYAGSRVSDFRIAELGNRCFVAKYLMAGNDRSGPVVGVGLTSFGPGKGSAQDITYLDVPDWSEEDSRKAAEVQAQLGYYQAPMQKHHEDEYPAT